MQVEVTINSHLCLDRRLLAKKDKKCFNALKRKFTKKNPKYASLVALGYPTTGVSKKVYSYHTAANHLCIARGCFKKLKKVLKKHGHTIIKIDKRLVMPEVTFNSIIKLRDEQEEPVSVVLKKNQGIIIAPCSAGKTIILLEAIARCKQPAVVIVWNIKHQKQWIAAAKEFLLLTDEELGGVGGVFKKRKFGKLNICMQQSLNKKSHMDYFASRVGFVGGDEIQRFAAKTFQDTINFFPAKQRIGVTADETRSDKMEFLIHDAFGKVVCEMADDDIGSRMEATVYLVPTEHYSYIQQTDYHPVGFRAGLVKDPVRNDLICKVVRSRANKGRVCLVLTERVEHALYLAYQLREYKPGLIVGKIKKEHLKKLRSVPKKQKLKFLNIDLEKEDDRIEGAINSGKMTLVVSTAKGDVGMNIKKFDDVFVTMPSQLKRFVQQKGRAERFLEGKEKPGAYYFWDRKMNRFKKVGENFQEHFKVVKKLNMKGKKHGNNKRKYI